MMMMISGEFSVVMVVQVVEEGSVGIGCMVLDKCYYGLLDVCGVGQMLVIYGSVVGLVVYVVLEMVIGMLQGCEGSFVLVYYGLMDCGQVLLDIVVVLDLGIGGLVGLQGCLCICVEGYQYFYDFEFLLFDV